MSMAAATFAINSAAPSRFLGSDGKLEIDVPSNALTAADVSADGGSTSLSVTQILPMSGSNAGGSGHFSFGTYLIQVLDAKGNVAKHGLRSPVTLRFHFGSQLGGLDLAHSYAVLNGAFPSDMNVVPSSLVSGSPANQLATLKALNATAALGPLTNLSPTYDAATQTLSAQASLATPLTSSSFGTNSSVATFGKPQPFEATLSGAALTASYPIDLPPGPKGFKPPLTLSYSSAAVNDQHNSQGAAGWVGEGWNMSLGAISWAEHYVADTGSTTWQDSWQLSDPYGTGAALIPPTTTTATYLEDSGRAMTPEPIQWQTDPEIYAKIFSFTGPVTLPGTGSPAPPCFRVFLTDGTMEEFGCTQDSLQYYLTSAGKPYISSWLLDLIIEPDGNQIHVTYNQDMETLYGISYPRDAVLSTVEWDSPTCSNATFSCTKNGVAPNLWVPLLRASFSAAHAVALSPSGSTNCGAPRTTNVRCDNPLDLTSSGGVAAPIVQSDFVLNDLLVQVCDTSCASSPTWNTLKDYRFGYDQSGPGSIPIDPISGKQESTAGKLNLTQLTVIGDDNTTALPVTNFTYVKQTNYYEDSSNYPAASPSSPVSSTPNKSTNCGPSSGVGAFNTGYTPNPRGCLLWNQSYDGNSYYLASTSNGLGLAESFAWANLRANLHGTDWANGHNGGYYQLSWNPIWCDTNQSNIYPCDMADDGSWSRIGLASRSQSVVRLTQNGQGGAQTPTTITSTTSYAYQDTFPLASQGCPLLIGGLPSQCVAGFMWGSQYDNDYLDFYNLIFMGFAQVQVTNPDNSVEVHKFYTSEGWGGWTTQGTNGLTLTCPFAPYDVCHPSPYWDIAIQQTSPGQANALHGREYEVDRYDTNGTTLLEQTTTQFTSICTPPSIPSGSPSVSTYTNNGWSGNLVDPLDLTNPVVPCDIQVAQVDDRKYDGATGTVPDQTTKYTYESGTRPCSTCYGRPVKVITSSNDGGTNGSPTSITNTTAYIWDDTASGSINFASGLYLINFPAVTDTEDGSGNRYSCTYTSYDGQANTQGASPYLTQGNVTRVSAYTNCALPLSSTNELANTSFYDSLGNLVATRDPNTTQNPRGGCVIPSRGSQTWFTTCATFDSYFSALVIQQSNRLSQTSATNFQVPGSATAGGGFGLWPASSTDANGQTTSFTYDALGRSTSTTLPQETSGLTTQSSAYTVWCSGSAAQSPCAEIDQTQRINSTSTVTSRAFYDGAGNLVETRSPGASGDVVQYYYYDKSERLVFKSVPYFVTAYSGAPGSAAFSIPDSTIAGTSYTYDGLGRQTSVKDALSNQTSTTYGVVCNAAGTGDSTCYEQVMTVDPLNHQSGVLNDALGRTNYVQRYTGNSTSTYAVYATTKYTYDFAADLIQILQPDGLTKTTYQYDMAGRQTGMTDPDRGVESYTYDLNGNLTQSVDARGSAGTVYAGYDPLNRPIWRNTTNNSSGAYDTYSYDSTAGGNNGVGRLTGETFSGAPANSLSGSYGYLYDARGQQTAATLSVGSNSYPLQTNYDDAGTVLSQVYPDGETVTNSYTAQDWLSGVTTSLGPALLNNAAYTGVGGASGSITSANLASSAYQYSAAFDLLARATDINVKQGSTTLFDQTRAFDAAGNVKTANTTLTTGTDNQAFCYDEQNRLTSAASIGSVPCQTFSVGTLAAAGYTQSFAYDNMGRLTSGPLGTYTYGNSAHVHAATSIGSAYTAAYDASGNMTCRAPSSATTCRGTQTGAQLGYNNEGQLTAWQNQPGNTTTTGAFLYDGQGNRVAQQMVQGGVTTTDVYVGDIEQVTYVVGGTSTITPLIARRQVGTSGSAPAAIAATSTTAAQAALAPKSTLVGPLGPSGSITKVSATAPTIVRTASATSIQTQWNSDEPRTAGDLLIATGSSYTGTTLTIDSGWTQVAVVVQGGGNLRLGLWYKIATGSDAAPTITSAGASKVEGAVSEWTGNDPNSPLQANTVATNSATSGNSIPLTMAAAPGTSGGLSFATYVEHLSGSATVTEAPSSGWTQENVRTVSDNQHLGRDYRLNPSTASADSDSPTYTTTGTVNVIEGIIAFFQPASSGVVPPGAPTSVSATPGNAQASVSWTAPSSNGGAPISSYTATSTPGGFQATVNGSTTSATVSGLSNGTSYTFTVTATNSAGAGPASAPSNAVTPATVPGAPTNVTATGGMGQAQINWTAPASNGGGAISSYTVTSSAGGFQATVSGNTTFATVTGLTNGTSYTFTVTATNWAGTGSASSPSNAVTTGITTRTYYYAEGMRIAAAVNGVFSYLASDSLGSADVVLNGSGSVTASSLFAPYGSLRYATGTMPTDYGFTGQHSDTSTGLDYFGARYYDPLSGQFTSADTVLPGGGFDVWGLSRYAYIEGNPVDRTDPSGRCASDSCYAAADYYHTSTSTSMDAVLFAARQAAGAAALARAVRRRQQMRSIGRGLVLPVAPVSIDWASVDLTAITAVEHPDWPEHVQTQYNALRGNITSFQEKQLELQMDPHQLYEKDPANYVRHMNELNNIKDAMLRRFGQLQKDSPDAAARVQGDVEQAQGFDPVAVRGVPPGWELAPDGEIVPVAVEEAPVVDGPVDPVPVPEPDLPLPDL